MAFPDTESNLVISSGGVEIEFPIGSARGINQTLEHIGQASSFRRTINGDLVCVSSPLFQKYRSTITCSDINAPTLDGVWPDGTEVTVDCIAELSYPTGESPQRSVVSGSSRTDEDGDFTFYRPQLTMMVLGYSVQSDEYGARTGWTLNLEEI
jgi:hypothetical protein